MPSPVQLPVKERKKEIKPEPDKLQSPLQQGRARATFCFFRLISPCECRYLPAGGEGGTQQHGLTCEIKVWGSNFSAGLSLPEVSLPTTALTKHLHREK